MPISILEVGDAISTNPSAIQTISGSVEELILDNSSALTTPNPTLAIGTPIGNPTSGGGLMLTGSTGFSSILEIHNKYANGINLYTHNNGTPFRSPQILFNTDYGTQLAPQPVKFSGWESNPMGQMQFGGWDGSAYYYGSYIGCFSDENWSSPGSGTVNTSGTSVSWVSGNVFSTSWNGQTIVINGVTCTVSTVNSSVSITLAASVGTQTGVSYSTVHHGSSIHIYGVNAGSGNSQTIAQFGGINTSGINAGNIIFYRSLVMASTQTIQLTSGMLLFNTDPGISRIGLGSLAIGNGTQGDTSGSLYLTSVILSDFGSSPTSAGTAGTEGEIVTHGGVLYFCSVTGTAGAATWNSLNMTAI